MTGEKVPFRHLMPVILGTGLYFAANIQRVAVPGTIFNELQQDLNLSAPLVTGFGSAFMYVYAAGQLFSGVLADRFGGMRVILFGALAFCTGSLLFPLSHDLLWMYAARSLTGLGASVLYLSLALEAMRLWGKNGGIAISFIIMTGFFGGVLANAPFALLSARTGCRPLLLGIGIFSLILFLFFLPFSGNAYRPEKKKHPGLPEGYFTVIRNRENRVLIGMTSLNFGLYYVLQTVMGKKFLEDSCGYSASAAAWILSCMGLISAFSGVGIAAWSRRLRNRRKCFFMAAGIVSLIVFPSISILLFLNQALPCAALFFLLLAATSSLSAIAIPMLKDINAENLSGTAASLLNFCFYIAVAVFGNIAGLMMNVFPSVTDTAGHHVYSRGSYLLVFSMMSLCSVVTALLAGRVRDHLS